MKNSRLYLICIGFFFVSCVQQSPKNQENSFPKIIVESDKDTVEVGETINFTVYLSDTSFLYIDEPELRKNPIRVYPVFLVNNEIVEDVSSDSLNYQEIASDSVFIEEIPHLREIVFSIDFPHPEAYEGSIQLNKSVNYFVK